MTMEEVITRLAQTLEKEGNVKAVFAEPIKLEHHTVVPVATVAFGAGVGGARGIPGIPGKALEALSKLFGFGGLGGIDVRPVGFIHERKGEVVFTAIHVDGKGTPLITEAASGIGRVVDTVTGIFTPERAIERPAKPQVSEKRPAAHA